MKEIKRIEVDGNDESGKTFRIGIIKNMFPNVEVVDRGLFSKYTLDEFYPRLNGNEHHLELAAEFRHIVRESTDTLYVIMDCPIPTCQQRIKNRGDSLEDAPSILKTRCRCTSGVSAVSTASWKTART